MRLSEVLLSEMKSDEFIADAKKAADYYNKEMKRIFPEKEYKAVANYLSNLGPHVAFDFADTQWKVTIHNSPVRILFMMHLSGNFGEEIEMNKFSIESLQLPRDVKAGGGKFRKITAKSPMEATKKLVAWFKKNKKAIMDVNEEYYSNRKG